MEGRGVCCDSVVPFGAMVAVEVAMVGTSTISKAAMARGMNPYVFIVYYNALATLMLLPYFIFHRRRPPLTFSLLCKIFILGLIGCCIMIFAFTGIDYSSPTLYSALSNLVPAFTFILSTIFRVEKLDLRSRSSQAKLLGTILSITGAITVTLYKGLPLIIIQPHSSFDQLLILPPKSNWLIGGLFLTADWFLMSIWYIFMATIMKEFPEKIIVTFIYLGFATIHSAIFVVIGERGSVWRLRLGIEYAAIVYAAIVGSLASTLVHAWCLRIKGPIYVSVFKPFGIVVAVIMSIIILGDTLYIGSVIGSIVILIGVYCVLWGNSKEKQKIEDDTHSHSLESSHEPLLSGNINRQRC